MGCTPPRYEVLHNLQEYDGEFTNSAIRFGRWKLITGKWANCTIESYPFYCFWVPPPEFNDGLLLHTSDSLLKEIHAVPHNHLYPEINVKAHISKSEGSYRKSAFDPVMLFDMENDPLERNDLKDIYPSIVDILLDRLEGYQQGMLSAVEEPWDIENWEKTAKEQGCFSPWNFE